ncbi:MAG: PBP1A family penicillin-binding protein [Aquificae bacterium]|nr:PBP1A family penicillin-binding protein [Aquificota bacterium]
MLKKLLILLTLLTAVLFSVLAGVFVYVYRSLPDPKLLESWQPPQASEVYDDKGRYYGSIGAYRRFYVKIDRIPPHVINAFIAVEDKNFWKHFGVDPWAVVRAFWANYKAGRIVQGGSTITQQLAKNLFLSPERTLERKIKEAILAVKIERTFPKEKILELYLNQIYLGSGAYGVEAAAQVYFGKHVWELTLEEAALLAGLPKAPARFNPFYNPEKALKRRNYVLKRMLEEGFITPQEYEEAVHKPLAVKKENKYRHSDYFLDLVKEYVFRKYGELAYKGRLKIYTTVDLELQRAAEQSLKEGLKRVARRVGVPFLPESEDDMARAYEKQKEIKKLKRGKVYVARVLSYDGERLELEVHGRRFTARVKALPLSGHRFVFIRYLGRGRVEVIPDLEGALVSVEARTGALKALVGGRSYAYSQFNRAVKAYRQPGSSIKPVIYLAALLTGKTQISVVDASPRAYYDPSKGKEWVPKNYDRRTYGKLTLRKALAKSINTAAVNLLDEVGFEIVLEVGRRLGLENLKPYYSLALGTVEVTPFRLTYAYQVFANLGKRCKPYFVKKIVAPDGRVLEENAPSCKEVLPAPETRVLVDMLRAVVLEGTAVKARSLGRVVAGKTGTTDDYKDAWFIGFSPHLVTGVWVGYDVKKSMGRGMTGSRAALPVWIAFMKRALSFYPDEDFPLPPETGVFLINEADLVLADESCPGKPMVFVKGTEPRITCSDLNALISVK